MSKGMAMDTGSSALVTANVDPPGGETDSRIPLSTVSDDQTVETTRVLVVDDNPIVRKILRHHFTAQGRKLLRRKMAKRKCVWHGGDRIRESSSLILIYRSKMASTFVDCSKMTTNFS